MNKTWYVLAVLVAVLPMACVIVWPDGPRWISPPNVEFAGPFSPDGRIVVTYQTPMGSRGSFPDPTICRWDARSGRLLSRATLPGSDPNAIKSVRPSGDGTVVLVGEGRLASLVSPNFETGAWYLHDGVTGERRLGPLPDIAAAGPSCFSDDNRWFVAYRGDPDGGLAALRGPCIHASVTGKRVFPLPGTSDSTWQMCHFAPDGNSAILGGFTRAPGGGIGRTISVQIIELPSGQEVRSLSLPEGNWMSITAWDGRYLDATRSHTDATGLQSEQNCRFDLSSDNPGPPLEDLSLASVPHPARGGTNYWMAGPDWITYVSMVPPPGPPTGLEKELERLRKWLGLYTPSMNGILLQVRIMDRPSGRLRREFPCHLIHPCFVSADGQLLICRGVDRCIEVWDTYPPLRWPWGMAAGLILGGSVLALGRRFKKKPKALAKDDAASAQG